MWENAFCYQILHFFPTRPEQQLAFVSTTSNTPIGSHCRQKSRQIWQMPQISSWLCGHTAVWQNLLLWKWAFRCNWVAPTQETILKWFVLETFCPWQQTHMFFCIGLCLMQPSLVLLFISQLFQCTISVWLSTHIELYVWFHGEELVTTKMNLLAGLPCMTHLLVHIVWIKDMFLDQLGPIVKSNPVEMPLSSRHYSCCLTIYHIPS